jgi:hypothetical protein
VGISADQRRTPSISADGRYVAFQGPNVIGSIFGTRPHVRDLLEGRTETVNVDSIFEGLEGTGSATISADGRFVALDVFDAQGRSNVYVFANKSTGRQSGLQRVPDGSRTLISKPVGAEQWAITQNGDDRSVTGNIFFTDGRPPQFVHCERVGDDGNPNPYEVQITFSCAGADACTDSSCPAVGAWQPIAESVVLPGSFFLPRVKSDETDSAAWHAPGAETPDAGQVASPATGLGAQERASGLQRTPDGRRTLVSKPVGAEQWAITQNEDDQSVTGNIFFTDGRPPQFVYCARVGDDGNPDPYDVQITFSCEGADACTESSCPEEGAWRTIDESVVLPGSFFLPPALGEGSKG